MLRTLRWEIILDFPCSLNLITKIRNGKPLLVKITEKCGYGRTDIASFEEWMRQTTSQRMKVTSRSWKIEGNGLSPGVSRKEHSTTHLVRPISNI